MSDSTVYFMRSGTPSCMGERRRYKTPSDAKAAAVKVFSELKKNALVYDNAAHERLVAAITSISEVAADSWKGGPWDTATEVDPMAWEVTMHWGEAPFTVRVELWKVDMIIEALEQKGLL